MNPETPLVHIGSAITAGWYLIKWFIN
jgi:hypothetical protein